MIGKFPRRQLRFEVSVVEHCNLNCIMCDHFSPLALPKTIDKKVFEEEIERLSKLFSSQAEYVYLLGGEPLLHEDLPTLCKITRNFFPLAPIKIYTNGLLLTHQTEKFWEAIRRYKISFIITKYPVNAPYETIEWLLKKKQVEYTYSRNLDNSEEKIMRYNPLDPKGRQIAEESFVKCSLANTCITLCNGKLYPCSIIPSVEHINRYFDLHFTVCKEDRIDIFENHTAKDILFALSQPVPFCRYCAVNHRQIGFPWSVSKKEVREWVLEEEYRKEGAP